MNEIKHKYILKKDVLLSAGEDAITKLAQKGNVIYVNFEELEKIAQDKKNSNRYEAARILEHITETGEINIENCEYRMPSGGTVSWKKNENCEKADGENVSHITKSAATKSKILRKGGIVEFPKFLTYGVDILNEGLIELEWNDSFDKINYDNICDIIEKDLVNNQIISINGGAKILQFKCGLISENDRNSRFTINESENLFEIINDKNIQSSLIPGFKPRNLEQRLAYKNLIDNDIEISIISGGSGSGKTIVPYVAAIESILGTTKTIQDKETKENIILFKTNDIIGGKSREMGFLPGDLFDKGLPYMKSYIDAHNICGIGEKIAFEDLLIDPRLLRNIKPDDKELKKSANKILTVNFGDSLYLPKKNPSIEIEHLQYARGRTFENKTVFVDEAQNYSPFEMKQLLERIGEGSKVFLIGDYEQIDNPLLSPEFNGLVYAANVLWNTHPRMHIARFNSNYRSQTAEIMRNKRAPRN